MKLRNVDDYITPRMVSSTFFMSELRALLEAVQVDTLAASGNYTADDGTRPQCVTFTNGRVVAVGSDSLGYYLVVSR